VTVTPSQRWVLGPWVYPRRGARLLGGKTVSTPYLPGWYDQVASLPPTIPRRMPVLHVPSPPSTGGCLCCMSPIPTGGCLRCMSPIPAGSTRAVCAACLSYPRGNPGCLCCMSLIPTGGGRLSAQSYLQTPKGGEAVCAELPLFPQGEWCPLCAELSPFLPKEWYIRAPCCTYTPTNGP